MNKGLINCFFLLALLLSHLLVAKYDFPDFDTSWTRYGVSIPAQRLFYPKQTKDRHLLERRKARQQFKVIYDVNIAKFSDNEAAPDKIPKVIHQIWMGSPVPEKFKAWMQSWAALSGWQYKLWTDKEIKKIKLYNQRLFDNAKDYGEKSDILRYEILMREGGVYVDVDFECINGDLMALMNKNYDFYAGFEPLEHNQPSIDSALIGNAFIAARPNHPLLKKLVYDLDEHYKRYRNKWAVIATGPGYLTTKVQEFNASSDNKQSNIFLPPTFLYPISYRDARSPISNYDYFLKPETLAVHYWSGSWRKR